MSKTVILNNKSFIIPEAGDQNYAEDTTAYLVEIASVLSSLSGALDILETDFTFTNNQVSAADITSFIFTTGDIAGFVADYIITRDNGINKITEKGQLFGFQTITGWELSRGNASNDVTNAKFATSNGDIGVEFSITSSGQVQYTSNDYSGQTTGIITFQAKSLRQ